MSEQKEKVDLWKHGTYIDLWSVVHFLSGVLLASVCYYFGLSFTWSTVITLVLVVLWELLEAILKIIESRKNVLMDVIIGMAGFYSLGYFHFVRGWPWSAPLFFSLLFVTLGMSFWGFHDFLRRGYR